MVRLFDRVPFRSAISYHSFGPLLLYQQVEVSVSYASDWSTQGVGVFVDDIEVSTGEGHVLRDGNGRWTTPGAPPGSAPNSNDVTRTTPAGFPEGPVTTTETRSTSGSASRASPTRPTGTR